jgi:hypothetical protein
VASEQRILGDIRMVNLRVLKPTRNKQRQGDIFRMVLDDQELIGCVILADLYYSGGS